MIQAKKNVYLEAIRIFALFWIIYNHSSIFGWQLFESLPMGGTYLLTLFLYGFCKINLPLFLMISGAVLLGKEETIQHLFRKRVARMLILILCVSVYYFIVYSFAYGDEFTVTWRTFFPTVYSSDYLCTYFLWLYIGFLVMLPVLRMICKTRKVAWYLVAGYCLIMVIAPTVEYFIGWNRMYLANYMGMYTHYYIYPILGYLISTAKLENFCPKKMAWLVLAGIISLALHMTIVYTYRVRTGTTITADYLAFFPAAAIFYGARYLSLHYTLPEKIRKLVLFVSPTVLGAFLLSGVMMWKVQWIYYDLLPVLKNQLLAALIWVFCTMVICQAITFLLRLIPGVKKIL